MALALIVLAVGSVVAGYAGLPSILGGGDWFARYLEPSFGAAPVEEVVEHGLEWTLMLVVDRGRDRRHRHRRVLLPQQPACRRRASPIGSRASARCC